VSIAKHPCNARGEALVFFILIYLNGMAIEAIYTILSLVSFE